VPVRVEFETETHRIRDVFTWNIHERLLSPEHFARVFAQDLDLDVSARQGAVETMAAQIKAQLEDVEGIASMDLSPDWTWVDERQPRPGDPDLDLDLPVTNEPMEETPECRVIVEVNIKFNIAASSIN
jgi:chromatin structure-remodeling complex subunit SFH1